MPHIWLLRFKRSPLQPPLDKPNLFQKPSNMPHAVPVKRRRARARYRCRHRSRRERHPRSCSRRHHHRSRRAPAAIALAVAAAAAIILLLAARPQRQRAPDAGRRRRALGVLRLQPRLRVALRRDVQREGLPHDAGAVRGAGRQRGGALRGARCAAGRDAALRHHAQRRRHLGARTSERARATLCFSLKLLLDVLVGCA